MIRIIILRVDYTNRMSIHMSNACYAKGPVIIYVPGGPVFFPSIWNLTYDPPGNLQILGMTPPVIGKF